MNDWADYWSYEIGVNVIPADTKNKKTWIQWSSYQNAPILEAQHEQWKKDDAFSKGMAVIPGKVWHNPKKQGLYLAFIDLDNQKAIDEFCNMAGKATSLEKLSEYVIVEQHKDEPNKAHIYCYTRQSLTKKSSDRISNLSRKIDSNEIPAFEVKGLGEHGIAYCTPSIHVNGQNYEIIGTFEPEEIDELEKHMDAICGKYDIPYLSNGDNSGKSLTPIKDYFKEDTKIYEGHNRHEALLRVMESLISRNNGILNEQQIRDLTHKWNLDHCTPPLDGLEEQKQWKAAIRYIERKNQQKINQNTSNSNNGQSESNNNNNNQTQNNAEIVVELAKNNTQQFFKDQYGSAFAVIKIVDHNEIIALESSRFRRYLSKLFYDNNNHKVVNTEAVNNAIQILQAKAEYESPTIPLSLRVAWSKDKGTIYFDLTDEKWRTVKITREGWSIVDEHPVTFVKYGQTSQIEPTKRYGADVFDRFLGLTNVKEKDSRLLLKVYITSLFIPDIPHVMLILHGEKGSAKSTIQTMIKHLVDPAKPSLLTVHNNRDEFIQQLNHNYVAYYDNTKYVPQWLSDEACKAVTGVGNTKRKLYTNDEDIVYEYKRCLGFNGINISLTEPDALDRSILIELDRIKKENRELESRIFTEFEQIQSALLGYIFDIVSQALSIKDSIVLNDLPRMADFALWGEAISRAMGYQPLEFINAYYQNIGRQNIEAIEAHPLGLAITKLCDEVQEESGHVDWYGSTTECLEKLNEIAEKHKINVNSKSWPKAANSLTRSLNKIRSNLLEGLGIELTISRLTTEDSRYKKNTSTIKVWTKPPLSPLSPPDQNQARILTKSSGDIIESGDIIPLLAEIPPLKEGENQAQISSDIRQSGDSGHSGGIIQNSLEDGPCSVDQLFKCPHCNFVNQYPDTLAHHIKFTHNNRGDKQ